jgi:hypothetical protein
LLQQSADNRAAERPSTARYHDMPAVQRFRHTLTAPVIFLVISLVIPPQNETSRLSLRHSIEISTWQVARLCMRPGTIFR